tara:strand:+ start:6381 stop:11807 length:5427 start_codon:yes stop_codon:yes gene_type:complete
MPDDTLKRSPFLTVTEEEPEKEELKRSPFATEIAPTLPTTSGFMESLGLVRDTGLLPEQPLPEPELATSPEIEEVKAEVEAEVEQGNIFKLRDEKDEVSKQFQALQAEQVEAEAMQLPTEKIRSNRAEKLKEWNRKDSELQARRAAFKEKTGFTPDEYGRSEKEIKLLRDKRINAEFQRRRAERAAGTTSDIFPQDLGSPAQRLEDAARDTDEASLLFGPSERRELEGKYALAREGSAAQLGMIPSAHWWLEKVDRDMKREFEKGYLSRDADTPEALKILSGTMAALFEGTPKTPLHYVYKYAKESADSGLADVRQAYGPDHPVTKYFEVYSGLWKVGLDFADVMTGNVGGVATIGVGGALGAAAKAGSTSAKVASAAIPATFATHIGDSLWASRQQIYNTLTDPEASLQEKTETAGGAVAAAVFGFMLTKGSLKQVEGVLESRYGLKIDVKNASKAQLAEAANRVIEVEEAYNAKEQGREAVPRESGDSLFTHLSKINVAQQFPKLKGERWSTYFKRVGEQQLLVRARPEASIHETGPIPPLRGPRPVEVPVERPLPPAMVRPDIERPDIERPEMVRPEAGSEKPYYDRQTLQVRPEAEIARDRIIEEIDPTDAGVMAELKKLQEEMTVENLLARDSARDAKIAEALKPEPAKPEVEAAVKEVKEGVEMDKAAEEGVRREDALVEAAEEAAVAAEEVPSGMPKRMLKLVERDIKLLIQNGDARSLAEAGRLKADPESYYDVFGSRRWADRVSRMDKDDVRELRAEMGDAGTEALDTILETREVELKYDEWRASKGDKQKEAVYREALQKWGERKKNYGQAIEALKHNPHITTEMIGDIIAAKQEQAVGGRKFTEEQRATLDGLVEKSQEAYKDLEKKQDKLNLEATEENYEAARESLLKANEAAGEQAEFLIRQSPRLWSDLYVTALQGNLLTPQTLLLNVVGNIIPAPMRATSRITARSMELIGEYLFTKPSVREQRRIELQEKREELKGMDKSAEGYIEAAAEVAKLEEAATSNFMLQPLRGTLWDKPRGFIEGIGIPKVWDALKAPKGTWGDLVKGKSERWRRHKYGGTDTAISSMLHGQRMHQYEAGVGEAAINPVSPVRALRKIAGSLTGKGDKLSANEYAKAMVESFQFSPSTMFKLLSGGDLPFRHAEFRRVIDNFGRRRGKARGWTKAETKDWVRRAKESPELMLTEKENMALWNDASKSTFQNENWLTDKVGKINQWFRDPMKKGAEHSLARAAYIPYRTITPYQKTLLNITAETAAFSPLGLLDAKFNYGPKSFIYKKFGRKYAAEQKQLAYAKAVTGMTLYGLYELLTQDEWRDDVIRADFSSGVTDKSAKIRHLTEDVVPHGTLNLSSFARGVRGFLGSDEKTTPQAGDNVINLQEFGVVGDILLTAAAYHEKKKGMTEEERKAIDDNWLRGAFSLGGSAIDHKSKQMLNRGMAQNMKQVVQGLLRGDEVGTWAKPFGRAITALAIPNTLDWFYNNSKDNPKRRDFRTTDVVEATAEGWTRKLVATGVKGEENPILFDMWGRSIDRVRRGGTVPTFEWDASKWVGLPLLGVRKVNPRNQVDRYIFASMNIMRQGQLITDIHSSEIYRLWDLYRDDDMVPGIASRLMTIDETEYKLNRDQYAVLQRLNGMFRMSGPIVTVGPDEASGARGIRGGNWAGMRELIGGGDDKKLEGIAYRKPNAPKRLTTWNNLKPEVQVDEIKKMVSGSKSDARKYFLENFVKDKPNRIALITLAGLDLDRVGMTMMSKAERDKYLGKKEADAKKVIKGYTINWDNLGFDKLEAVGEPSGKARKPLEK